MKGTGHGQIFLILIRVLTVTCLDKKIPNERYRTWTTIPNVG